MQYHFKIHEEKSGYWAECIELKGCNTEGETLDELHKNIQEVLGLYLSEPSNSNLLFPAPKSQPKKKTLSKFLFLQMLHLLTI